MVTLIRHTDRATLEACGEAWSVLLAQPGAPALQERVQCLFDKLVARLLLELKMALKKPSYRAGEDDDEVEGVCAMELGADEDEVTPLEHPEGGAEAGASGSAAATTTGGGGAPPRPPCALRFGLPCALRLRGAGVGDSGSGSGDSGDSGGGGGVSKQCFKEELATDDPFRRDIGCLRYLKKDKEGRRLYDCKLCNYFMYAPMITSTHKPSQVQWLAKQHDSLIHTSLHNGGLQTRGSYHTRGHKRVGDINQMNVPSPLATLSQLPSWPPMQPPPPAREWTAEEDAILLHLVSEIGLRWTEIAHELDGRSDSAVRNRYHRLTAPAEPKSAPDRTPMSQSSSLPPSQPPSRPPTPLSQPPSWPTTQTTTRATLTTRAPSHLPSPLRRQTPWTLSQPPSRSSTPLPPSRPSTPLSQQQPQTTFRAPPKPPTPPSMQPLQPLSRAPSQRSQPSVIDLIDSLSDDERHLNEQRRNSFGAFV